MLIGLRVQLLIALVLVLLAAALRPAIYVRLLLLIHLLILRVRILPLRWLVLDRSALDGL